MSIQKCDRNLSLVAHSMGGLVCREMLTRPDIDYRRSAQNKLVPGVAALIMVGTPNHGSPLARFRLFAEARGHIAIPCGFALSAG